MYGNAMKFIIAAFVLLMFTTPVNADRHGDTGFFRYLCPSAEAGVEAAKEFITKPKTKDEWLKARDEMFDGNPCAVAPFPIKLTVVEAIKTFVSAKGTVITLMRAQHSSGAEFFVFGVYTKNTKPA